MTKKRTQLATLVAIVSALLLMVHGCAVQSGPASQTAGQAKMVAIDAISASDSADQTSVTIKTDGPVTFSSFKKPDPPAVVLILPTTDVDRLPANPTVNSDLIKNVVVNSGNGGKTARIEFQLTADAPYAASQQGNEILLTFKRPGSVETADQTASVPEPQDNPAEDVDQPAMASPPTPAVAEAEASPAAESDEAPAVAAAVPVARSSVTVPKTTAWVNKIDFLSESKGKSTLVVGTTHAVNYQINKISARKIQVELLNTRIPAYRQRALITTRFSSAVDRVVPYQRSKNARETLVSIELREAVPYHTEQVDNLLLVHFDASSIPPKPLEQAQLPAWKQSIAAESGPPAMGSEQTAGGTATQEPASVATPPAAKEAAEAALDENTLLEQDLELKAALGPRHKHYTGEKIALDFYDTDIKNVFRILREVSGKNFAIDKDVNGKVTMTLDQPVPWDQVLDLVLRMNQLGMTEDGGIVRIATLETLKKEDDLRKAKLSALKAAREEAKALEPLVTRYIPISYSNAEDEVKPHIEKILTNGRGSVTVDSKNNQIIITDTMAKVKQAEEIIRRIDKVTSQVVIEARVVEVSEDFSKELGIDWSASYGPGIMPGTDWNTTYDMAMNLPSASTSSIGLSFSRLSGVPFVLNARLNALETSGNGRILSAPKILTLDNKKAKIKQGVEYAYLERDSSGGSSVKFKNIDLLLEVTPHVTPDDRISLIIYITKNDVAGITAGVPNVATNEAQTELLVNDGDTVVIGGIIKKTENQGKSAFPVLSKIPVLGWAFQNNTDKSTNDELLIFITPRIVQLEQQMAQTIN
jgi:type IV pilus assembly protein PilQ